MAHQGSVFSHGMAKWGLFMAALFGLWFGGWFYAANWVDGKIATVLANLKQNDVTVECPQREMRGFPFRMGIYCQTLAIDDRVHGYQLQAGELRSVAQIYIPKENIIELDGPAKFSTGGFEIAADWQAMRTFFVATRGGFEGLSTHYRELSVDSAVGKFISKSGAVHLRPTPGAGGNSVHLDVAINLENLHPVDGTSLAVSLKLDAMLADGYSAFVTRRERPMVWMKNKGEIQIRSAVLSLPDGGRLALSGPMKINADGTLSGTIRIGMKNKDSLMRWISAVNPQFAPVILGLGQGMDMLGQQQVFGSEKLKAIEVQIDRGRVRVGFFEVGEIPPLFD